MAEPDEIQPEVEPALNVDEPLIEDWVGTWQHIQAQGQLPAGRWGHASVYLDGNMYVFGGYGGQHFGDVFALDMATLSWRRIETRGDPPSPRDSHSGTLVQRTLLVMGGTDGTTKLDEVWQLSLDDFIWTRLVASDLSISRESHTATVVAGDQLVLFAGSGPGPDDFNYLNDVQLLNLTTFTWQSAAIEQPEPAARDSHAAAAVGDSGVLVFGGDCGHHYYGDTWLFHTETFRWEQVIAGAPQPSARAGHCACSFDAKVLIQGGVGESGYYSDVWLWDVQTSMWQLLRISEHSGQPPPGRFAHSACITPSAQLLVFGGCGKDEEILSDLWVLHLHAPDVTPSLFVTPQLTAGFKPLEASLLPSRMYIAAVTQNLRAANPQATDEELEDAATRQWAMLQDEEKAQYYRAALAQDMQQPPPPLASMPTPAHEPAPPTASQSQSRQGRGGRRRQPAASTPEFSGEQSTAGVQTGAVEVKRKRGRPRKRPIEPSQTTAAPAERASGRAASHGHLSHRQSGSPRLTRQLEAGAGPSSLVGAAVEGRIDGAFDSGYFVTVACAAANRTFRGILFSPVIDVPTADVHNNALSVQRTPPMQYRHAAPHMATQAEARHPPAYLNPVALQLSPSFPSGSQAFSPLGLVLGQPEGRPQQLVLQTPRTDVDGAFLPMREQVSRPSTSTARPLPPGLAPLPASHNLTDGPWEQQPQQQPQQPMRTPFSAAARQEQLARQSAYAEQAASQSMLRGFRPDMPPLFTLEDTRQELMQESLMQQLSQQDFQQARLAQHCHTGIPTMQLDSAAQSVSNSAFSQILLHSPSPRPGQIWVMPPFGGTEASTSSAPALAHDEPEPAAGDILSSTQFDMNDVGRGDGAGL